MTAVHHQFLYLIQKVMMGPEVQNIKENILKEALEAADIRLTPEQKCKTMTPKLKVTKMTNLKKKYTKQRPKKPEVLSLRLRFLRLILNVLLKKFYSASFEKYATDFSMSNVDQLPNDLGLNYGPVEPTVPN